MRAGLHNDVYDLIKREESLIIEAIKEVVIVIDHEPFFNYEEGRLNVEGNFTFSNKEEEFEFYVTVDYKCCTVEVELSCDSLENSWEIKNEITNAIYRVV